MVLRPCTSYRVDTCCGIGQIKLRAKNAIYSLDEPEWQCISASAKDLLRKLIVRNPAVSVGAGFSRDEWNLSLFAPSLPVSLPDSSQKRNSPMGMPTLHHKSMLHVPLLPVFPAPIGCQGHFGARVVCATAIG